jgi:hypothetical protein
VTTGNLNMRAGPDTTYPVVTTIPAGAPVQVFGCVNGRSWCDALWVGQRGWVSSAWLDATVWRTAPIVRWNKAAYWNQYYVGRPWFATPRTFMGPNHRCFRGPFVTACR